MILRYVLAWIPMVFIAILNGVIREFTYGKRMSELAAHQFSTISALFLFGIYIFILTRIWRLESSAQAIAVGLIWLGLTVGFEFLFGHYVAGHSWERLFQDYNMFAGRIWILVLIWITCAPYYFYSICK